MSTLVKFILGGLKSQTNQANGIFGALWASIIGMDMIQTNPEYVAILAGIQTIFNIIQRSRKGHKPLTEK